MLAFPPQVCHPCKNSMAARGSGGRGSCYHCGCGENEGPGTSQKRGGPKGTSGMSPLHLTPVPCPHAFLDLLSPSLKLFEEVIFFQGEGGHLPGCLCL